MADTSEFERLAEADGAPFIRTATGVWWARDKDGITVVRGAMSKAEAGRLYCEDKGLVASTPEMITVPSARSSDSGLQHPGFQQWCA
jgi:hypothetical protein